MLNINDLKAEINSIFDEEFEPIINAQELVNFYVFLFKEGLSLSEIIAIFDKSIQGRDVRAFIITENDNFGYFDQGRKHKIFNKIHSEISGFCFLLIDEIAFLSYCESSQIYISVKDFEACHKTVVDAYPLDKIYYLRKDNIKKLKSDTITNNNNPDEIARLNAIIEQQAKEITEIKAEIENLKKPETAQSVINYDECSIYGHTSENLEMLFTLAKKIASKCDPDNPHSYPNKDDYLNYVKKYHSDSSKLSEAFYQILTPEKVKNKGRTPKGVETFKGFI